MKGRFLINMKIGEEIFFSSEKNLKGVCEWEMAYEENPEAEEFKVYEKNNDGLTYSLIHSTYKRKIGFQEVKKWLEKIHLATLMAFVLMTRNHGELVIGFVVKKNRKIIMKIGKKMIKSSSFFIQTYYV